jgi:hypothetical protein
MGQALQIMVDDDLSDEQLHQLLMDAEQRLKNTKKNQITSLPTTQGYTPPASCN